ncbi:hypothetical protein ACU21_03220 [Actinobaculum suis]|nr:hypothetical protein ACU20_04640 [Actinobaculum suis]OCA95790.1 hypothetical protein ACU21_03220 [Actinobaculum suis]
MKTEDFDPEKMPTAEKRMNRENRKPRFAHVRIPSVTVPRQGMKLDHSMTIDRVRTRLKFLQKED